MSKFLVILRREYAQLVKKKSFLIMTLLTPGIMVAFMFLPAFFMQQGSDRVESFAVIDRDGHGLGQQLADAMESYLLADSVTQAYRRDSVVEISAEDAELYNQNYERLVQRIRERKLQYLMVLNRDAYLADSALLLVTNSDNIRTLNRLESQVSKVLAKQRVEISRLNIPVDSVMALTRTVDLPRRDTKGEVVSTEAKFITGTVLMMLIYMLILIDGQAMMQSVIDEKSGRIMEVLVSSATPFQIMAGKIVGTGLAALTQVGIWILGAVLLMAYSASSGTQLDSSITRSVFNPATVVCFACFLVLGYLLFSTIFAFIGSLVNSTKEAQPLIMPVIMILFVPAMMIGFAVLESPDAGWLRVVSFFPTYTPLVMMMRVSVVAPTVDGNPLLSPIMGEAVLSMIGMVLALFIAVWITSRVFRVGILMYGKRPTLPEIVRWVRHG
ncbi:MAG: ABC transporter permease [Candidatus Zixiibacteriota bacterium]